MTYKLTQFFTDKATNKAKPMVYTTYPDLNSAFKNALAMHEMLHFPYAGFTIKDETGNIIRSKRKEI